MPPPPSSTQTIAEWQALAARDPRAAARELSRRLRSLLPPARQAAAIASRATPRALEDAFARAAAVLRAGGGVGASRAGADAGGGAGASRAATAAAVSAAAVSDAGVNAAGVSDAGGGGAGGGGGGAGAGAPLPLAGAPYVLKDLFHAAGHPLLAGSGFPAEILAAAHAPPPPGRGTGIVRALDEAGAVLAAKTHLHEFAYGITGENPFHGDCAHPCFPRRVSGGSSSGTAVAVASGLVPFGIGTDTGGSIRVPAAFCGLHGLRLGAGHPWMSGAFPLAPGFDTPGWLTRTASDMLAVNRALLGAPAAAAARPPRGCFLDLAALGLALDAATAGAVREAARRLAPPADRATRDQFAGAFRGALEAYSILQSTEAFAVHAAWLDRHRGYYSAAVWALIDRGRHWTRAQRAAARRRRATIRALFREYFRGRDFLVMPATPFPALTKSCCTPENRNRLLTLNAPASLAGLPVLALPVALGGGLSAGLQFIVPDTGAPAIPWALETHHPKAA
ncbi:MAG: amidase [Opitutaceae bacterium]|jgi:amidase/aspartyl-tRNA(Asn)/glutamyl-tRNA(Gln) amidotransferase subunit A|nr:amidase [Opitutaceae bacterium]